MSSDGRKAELSLAVSRQELLPVIPKHAAEAVAIGVSFSDTLHQDFPPQPRGAIRGSAAQHVARWRMRCLACEASFRCRVTPHGISATQRGSTKARHSITSLDDCSHGRSLKMPPPAHGAAVSWAVFRIASGSVRDSTFPQHHPGSQSCPQLQVRPRELRGARRCRCWPYVELAA